MENFPKKSTSHHNEYLKKKKLSKQHQQQQQQDDNDLTNLNWLQDVNLVQKVYPANEQTFQQQQQQQKDSLKIDDQNADDDDDDDETKSFNNEEICKNFPDHNDDSSQQINETIIKPPYSYSLLIFMAIESSPTRSMMVRDIYKWIINRYPFFLTAPSGWKNTIRHTLSLRKCFKKINNNHGKNNDSDLKSGGYWYVDPEYRSILLQQAQRIGKNSSSSSLSSNQQLPSTKSILKGKDLKRKNKPIDPIVIDSKNKPNQQLPSITNNNHYKQYYLRRENNNYYHPIKMNSNYFVYNNNNHNNPNSIRIDNIISKGNIYRNLISIISVNQSPKIYAPMPIPTTTTTIKTNNNHDNRNLSTTTSMTTTTNMDKQQQQQRGKHYSCNLLKDKQNVCNHHLATNGVLFNSNINNNAQQATMVNNNNNNGIEHCTMTTTTKMMMMMMKNNNSHHHHHHQTMNESNNFFRKKFVSKTNKQQQQQQTTMTMTTTTTAAITMAKQNDKRFSTDMNTVITVTALDQNNNQNNQNSNNIDNIDSLNNQKSIISVLDNNRFIDNNNSIDGNKHQNNDFDIDIDDDDDDDDGMLRDGAQALLNFASKSFLFDLI